MYRIIAAIATILGLAALLSAQPDVPLVAVHAECADGALGAHSVSPDQVMVPLGSDVDWELDDASTATDLTIEPKDQRHWPWAGDEKPRGRHGRGERAKAHGAKMRRNARGTYQYNIQLSCPDGNGGTTTVTIDPGIIVH